MPKEDRRTIFKMLKNLIIKDSEIQSSVGDGFLPDYIPLTNGDVFEIAKKKRILSYPNIYKEDTWEFMLTKVAL